MIEKFLDKNYRKINDIYSGIMPSNSDQEIEIRFREQVSSGVFNDYLDSVAKSHSIEVMDHEVKRFLKEMPQNSILLDVGGCWGWHWRDLFNHRPDIKLVIIDLVKKNLEHAKIILEPHLNKSIFLLHADVTNLPIRLDGDFLGFNGVWSVQTLQHIPSFRVAISEIFRVLKSGGIFTTYSLNKQAHVRVIYKFFRRPYHISGMVDGQYWLELASQEQKEIIEEIFGVNITERWSEFIFSPELGINLGGQHGSLIGKLDSLISNDIGILGWLARQKSFYCKKP